MHAAGPTVNVELATEEGDALQAELSQEQQAGLRLRRGEEVYVRARQKRVFVEDYEIRSRRRPGTARRLTVSDRS